MEQICLALRKNCSRFKKWPFELYTPKKHKNQYTFTVNPLTLLRKQNRTPQNLHLYGYEKKLRHKKREILLSPFSSSNILQWNC